MDLDDALSDLLARRRSCRSFAPGPLGDDEVEAILAVGRPSSESGWAYPSAHDRRPVRVTRVPDHVSRQALEAAVFDEQPWLVDAPVLLAVTARLGEVVEEFSGQDPDGLRGRDFVMIEAGALAQTVLLACTARGLGAVVVAGLCQEAVREVLATDAHVVALIALGRHDPPPP